MSTPVGIKLNTKQSKALDEALTEATDVYGVDISTRSAVRLHFLDEVRPGRGCDVEYFAADSDHIIAGYVDVYGNGYRSVGSVDWTHSSANEDCDCAPCARFRTEDDDDGR